MSNVRTVNRLEGEPQEGLAPVEIVRGYLVRKSKRSDRTEYMLIGRPAGRASVTISGRDSAGHRVVARIESSAPSDRQVERAIAMKGVIERLRRVGRRLPLVRDTVKLVDFVATEILSEPLSEEELETARRKVAVSKGVNVEDVLPVPDLGPGW